MREKPSVPANGLSEERLVALFEHVNSARVAKGLAQLDLASRQFWSFSQDLHEAAAAYHRKQPTKAEFQKTAKKAVTQARKAREALIELQFLVKPFGPEFLELRARINALLEFESEWADKRLVSTSDQRFENLVMYSKLAWEAADAGKARVSRPPEGASAHRPRGGLFADFVVAVLGVIDPAHGRTNIARSLEDILPRFNISDTTPKK